MHEYQSHKHVSVVLNEKEAQMLSKLLEYYRLPSYSDVLRSALHRMYFEMQQAQRQEEGKVEDCENLV